MSGAFLLLQQFLWSAPIEIINASDETHVRNDKQLELCSDLSDIIPCVYPFVHELRIEAINALIKHIPKCKIEILINRINSARKLAESKRYAQTELSKLKREFDILGYEFANFLLYNGFCEENIILAFNAGHGKLDKILATITVSENMKKDDCKANPDDQCYNIEDSRKQ